MAEAYIRMVARLKAITAVDDLIDGRVYPMKAPQDVDRPYITYQIISRVPINHATGTSDSHHERIQINCWGVNYDGAQELAAAVRGDEAQSSPTGLSGFNDGDGRVWHPENERDDIELLKVGHDDVEAFRVIQEYIA